MKFFLKCEQKTALEIKGFLIHLNSSKLSKVKAKLFEEDLISNLHTRKIWLW